MSFATSFSKPATGFGTNTGFGSSAPTAFGSFGPAPTPASSSGFGTFSGFGATNSTAPGTGFGATSAATQNTGFGGFSLTNPTSAPTNAGSGFAGYSSLGTASSPSTGTGFGANPTSSTGTSGFGNLSAAFIGGKTSTAGGFGSPSFGSTSLTTTNPNAFGSSGLSTANSSPLFRFLPSNSPATGSGLVGGLGCGSIGSGLGSIPTTVSNPEIGWHGSVKIQELQRAYIPFFDQQGKPVMESNSSANNVLLQPNPSCEFYTILYNYKPNPNQTSGRNIIQSNASAVTRPSFINYQKWKQADLTNPDPNIFEPVVIMGAADLKRRFDSQIEATKDHELVLSEINKTLVMAKQASAKTEKRCFDMKNKQNQLRYQLLSVMRKIELLRCKGIPLDSEEMRLRERLDRVFQDVRDPALSVQRLQLLQSQSVVEREERKRRNKDCIAQEDLVTVHDTLAKQHQGLMVLSDVIRKDVRDMAIISEKLEDIKGNPALRHALDRFLKSLK